jgi:hypothetical protein
MATQDKNQPPSQNTPSQNRGKNLGQGLSGITDRQRRELAGTGDDAPTQDQREAGREGSASGDPRSNERSEEQSGSRH